MTRKRDDQEFLKIAIPRSLKRDLEDCLRLRGVERFTSQLFRLFAEEFVQQTKAELAEGNVEQWGYLNEEERPTRQL